MVSFYNVSHMLNLNSIMVGTMQPKVMADFYEAVFEKKPDMTEGNWSGWQVGSSFFSVGEHSEVKDKAKEPQRLILNLETKEVRKEFERIKALGATIIKEPYQMSAEGEILPEADENGMWIATFADPDGNYLQLMSPWKG